MKKILIVILSVAVNGSAQTTVNPDISVIGKFNTFTNNVMGTTEYGKLNFDIPEAELLVEGYLNPYARAVFNVAYHDSEFHVEEIFAHVVRGIPLDIQIKVGKYLLGFGRINITHPHAWSFIYRPLYHQIYFGDEGFNDIGINLSFILPTDYIYTTLDIGIFKGDALLTEHRLEDEHKGEAEGKHGEIKRGNSPIFVGKLESFFTLGDFSNLGVGFSGSYGVHSKQDFNLGGDTTTMHTEKPLFYSYGGIDFKYKFRPDSYSALTIQGEGFWSRRDVLREDGIGINTQKDLMKIINTFGAFLYIDYRFSRIFSVGVKYDFTFGIIDDEPSYNALGNDDQNKTNGIEGWFGFYPVEETLALRLGLQHLMFDYADGTEREGETTVNLQLIFSLGPHKAHPF